MQAWVNDLVAKDLAASTIRQTYACFDRVLRAAVIARLIPASPCQNIQLPRTRQREMHFLSPDQVSVLASAVGPDYESMIYFATYTGLRWARARA